MAIALAILARLPRFVWAGLAVIAILAGVFHLGQRDATQRAIARDLEAYNDTLQKIDRATDNQPVGADAARDRLRNTFGPWRGDVR